MRQLSRAFVIAVTATVIVGAWFLYSGSRGPAFGGWQVVSGQIRLEGAELVAVDGVRLRSGDTTLTLEPGSRLRRAGDDGTLPELVKGRAELIAVGDLTLGDETYSTGGEPIKVSLTPSAVRLLEGRLRGDGLTFHPGDLVPLGPLPTPVAPTQEQTPELAPSQPEDVERVGQVVDARTGVPVPDVLVTATYSRFDDGYPPLPFPGSRVRTTTDGEGFIRLPAYRPSDPRALLHLETDHPDFESQIHVIEAPADVDARRQFTVLRLRRAYTFRVRVLAPDGLPLANEAIQFTPPSIGRESFIGEDSWEEGRSLRAGRSVVRYTQADGTLRLVPRNESLKILHPSIYAWHPIKNEPTRALVFDHAGWPPLPDVVPDAPTRYAQVRSYLLQDSDGVPLANMPVEIDLDDMEPVRLYTDALGEFVFGPRPFPPFEPRLSTDNPRHGTLVVKSTAFWKHQREVQFPSVFSRLTVEGRVAATLTFRLMTLDENDDPVVPVPPNGLAIESNLTLVRRDRSGEVVYEGQLPDAGTTMDVSVRGFLPTTITVPTHDSRQPALDLGEIVLEAGERLDVELLNPEWEEDIETRFLIADVLAPEQSQEYPFAGDGSIVVGGLRPGHRYAWAVEGSRIPRVEGELVADEKTVAEGLAVPVTILREVECRLFGSIMLASDAQGYDYRVVERYFFPDTDKPVAYRSYPLAEDGIFGSVRKLPHPYRAEVFIRGPHLRSGYASRVPEAPLCTFDMGRPVMGPAHTAEFAFRTRDLPGPVRPPGNLSLFAEENDDHELVGIASDFFKVELAHLRPGRYILRWGSEDDLIEAHVFDIRPDTLAHRDVVLRESRTVEVSEIVLQDRQEDPVEGAVVRSTAPLRSRAVAGGLPIVEGIPLPRIAPSALPPGHYLVSLYARRHNEIEVRARDFLPARVKLPRGVGIDAPLTLRKSSVVEAQVRDLRGYPFEGTLQVNWEHEQRADRTQRTVVHGEPFAIEVVRGKFAVPGFPPGEHAYHFRHATSEAAAKRVLLLSEGGHTDIGKLHLEENRSVRGLVVLPEGTPAADAIVALVPPEKSYRWPQRDTNLLEQTYSTRTDALGRFAIEGLPLDLREDLALIARLEGYTDAVLVPVDLSGTEDLEVALLHETTLTLDLGYVDRRSHPDYEFRLEYIEGDELERDLGPLAPPRAEDSVFRGISPGIYRARWGLRQPHPDVLPWVSEVAVWPARPVQLSLPIPDRFITGEARFLDQPLERGWVILTDDPGDPDATRIGRVRDGAFEIGVPRGVGPLFGALIPERNPLPRFNPYRGEAIPLSVAAQGETHVRVEYTAHDLTIRFDPELLDRHADLQIEFPHYRWTGTHYAEETRVQPVEEVVMHLGLLRPGLFTFRVRAPGRFSRTRTVELNQDTVISFSR